MSVFFWLRYSIRSLRRSGRRAVFALICIAVGVASLVALETATLTVQNALTSNVKAANGGDVSVTSQDSPIAARDLAIFNRLQRTGKIVAWTAVYSVHATAVSPSHHLVPFDVRVVSTPPYPLGGQPTFVAPSNGEVAGLLRRSGDVLVTSVLADELGIHIGDRFVVNSLRGTGLRVTIRGILAGTSFEHAAVMTAERRDAAVLSRGPQQYSEIYVNVNGSVAPVADLLRRQFPVATIQTVQEALQSAQQQVHDFRQFMLLVGLLALLVAGIGILNAMQSILAWRRLEIAMLKAVGFPQGTLYGLFGGEALLMGLAGGVAGSLLGALASKVITDALARALAIQVTFTLDVTTLLGGIALGAGATLIFAILPIVRAAGFRPLEILRDGGISVRSGIGQTIALIAVIMVLFCGLAIAIMGDAVAAAEFVGGAFVAFLVFGALFSLLVGWLGRIGPPRSPVLGLTVAVLLVALTAYTILRVPALAALLALGTILWLCTLLPRRQMLSLVIAARSLSRRRARTSVTLVAFLVGILAMTITLTVALNLQAQITDALASNGSTNLVATGSPADEGAIMRAVNRLPGVQARSVVTVVSTRPVTVDGRPLADVIGPAPAGAAAEGGGDDRTFLLGGVTGLNLRAGDRPANVRVTLGRRLGLGDSGSNNVLVRDDLRYFPWNLKEGSTVGLREATTGTTRVVHIAGFYKRTRRRGFGSFFTAPVFADRALAIQLGGSSAQSIVSLTVKADVLTHDATTLQGSVPGILVVDIGDLTRVINTILGELLNLLAVITALALGAGLAVVGNGVALSMLERRREIALYKAMGFGPSTVLRFVLVENGIAGTLAGAMSVLGVVAALSLLSRLALDRAIGFDPVVALLVLALSTSLAVATAYLAARTPIKVRPIEALRND